jgi:hypothetical protein
MHSTVGGTAATDTMIPSDSKIRENGNAARIQHEYDTGHLQKIIQLHAVEYFLRC